MYIKYRIFISASTIHLTAHLLRRCCEWTGSSAKEAHNTFYNNGWSRGRTSSNLLQFWSWSTTLLVFTLMLPVLKLVSTPTSFSRCATTPEPTSSFHWNHNSTVSHHQHMLNCHYRPVLSVASVTPYQKRSLVVISRPGLLCSSSPTVLPGVLFPCGKGWIWGCKGCKVKEGDDLGCGC